MPVKPGRLVRAAAMMAAICGSVGADVQGQQARTARTADGGPDLSGLWNGGQVGLALQNLRIDERGNITVGIGRGRDGKLTNFERDSGMLQRADANRPLYKPQFWSRVQRLDENGNREDPEFLCMPAGVPRMGPPTKIVQTPKELIFLYNARNTFRVIYMDGRSHPPVENWEGRWYGHSIGRWDGDTLVIDSVDFIDASWLGWPGYFHSDNMRVEERLRRDGDTLHWQATVYDPDVLLKPWVMNPIVRRLNADPLAEIAEDLPCSERDSTQLVTKERG